MKYVELEGVSALFFFSEDFTHQFPFLHALHNHEQDLLRLTFAIIESLLNSHQKLLPDIIINQAGRGDLKRTFQLLFFFTRGIMSEHSKGEIV